LGMDYNFPGLYNAIAPYRFNTMLESIFIKEDTKAYDIQLLKKSLPVQVTIAHKKVCP